MVTNEQYDECTLTADEPRSPMAPLAQFALAVLAVVSFKIFLAVELDPTTYEAMLSDFREAGIVQELVVRVLTLDDASRALVEVLRVQQG